jgi:hypothetical protein
VAGRQQPEAEAKRKLREQAELDLNSAFFKTFNSRHGQQVLTYLRGAYIFGILPPQATADELRHREGQRSIVAEIEQRKEKAK